MWVAILDAWKIRRCFQGSTGEGWCRVLEICATGSCRFPWNSDAVARVRSCSFVLYCRTSDLAASEFQSFCPLSLLSFLSFLLTSLSYSSGLAHLAAFACPSTPLPLSCSFLTNAPLLYPVPRSDVHLTARCHSTGHCKISSQANAGGCSSQARVGGDPALRSRSLAAPRTVALHPPLPFRFRTLRSCPPASHYTTRY